SKRPCIVQDGLHGLMIFINAVTDATGEVLHSPRLNDGLASPRYRRLTSVREHPPSTLSGIFGKPGQTIADHDRRARGGLPDIQFPREVCCVGHVNPNAGQSMRLLLRP